MGDIKGALKDSRVAVARRWTSQPTCRIIKCCLALGYLDTAIKTIEKLIEIDPSNELINSYREQCKELQSFDKLATESFETEDFQKTGN